MKCRYDPKYVSQYKYKHTKHVKLYKKIRFPLDTQKEYLNREWPPLSMLSYFNHCVSDKIECSLWQSLSYTSTFILQVSNFHHSAIFTTSLSNEYGLDTDNRLSHCSQQFNFTLWLAQLCSNSYSDSLNHIIFARWHPSQSTATPPMTTI